MRNAYTTYLTMTGADSALAWFIFTVSAIYQVTAVGLDPLQLVLVGTTLEATAFFFKVPTGIVADVYSRKLSIVIGYVMMGIGFIVEGAFPFFATVLLAQVIWGAGWTFTSGATEAWLTDEIGEARAGRAFLRGAHIAQFTLLGGVAASARLGNVSITLPIIAGGVGFIALGIFLTLAMRETNFHPTPRENRNSFAHMWKTLRDGVAMIRKRPALKTILGVSLFWGLHSEGVDRLWTPFLLAFAFPIWDGLTTVTWFAIIRIASALLSIAVNEIVHRRVKMDDESAIRRALFALNGLVFASLICLALSLDFSMAVAAYLGWSLMRQTGGPLHAAWGQPTPRSANARDGELAERASGFVWTNARRTDRRRDWRGGFAARRAFIIRNNFIACARVVRENHDRRPLTDDGETVRRRTSVLGHYRKEEFYECRRTILNHPSSIQTILAR